MKSSVDLKRIATLINILAELKAIPKDDKEKGIRELMCQSVEEEFYEETNKLNQVLVDNKLKKVFIDLTLSEFLNKIKLYTTEISCINCEAFADCKLTKMIEEKRILPAWDNELEVTAMYCSKYIPHEDLITGKEFKTRAQNIFEILKNLGLKFDNRLKRNIDKFIDNTVLLFLEKTKEKNKIIAN